MIVTIHEKTRGRVYQGGRRSAVHEAARKGHIAVAAMLSNYVDVDQQARF